MIVSDAVSDKEKNFNPFVASFLNACTSLNHCLILGTILYSFPHFYSLALSLYPIHPTLVSCLLLSSSWHCIQIPQINTFASHASLYSICNKLKHFYHIFMFYHSLARSYHPVIHFSLCCSTNLSLSSLCLRGGTWKLLHSRVSMRTLSDALMKMHQEVLKITLKGKLTAFILIMVAWNSSDFIKSYHANRMT